MQFDFTLAPNASQQIDVAGKFFKYKSGTGLIRVRTSTGRVIDLLPGQGVWGVDFSSIMVSDRTGLQNNGVMLAGAFDFHDDRIAGQVEVIDGGRTRTNNGTAFTAHLYSAPVAALYSACQLWNPPGSGKNVIVNQVQAVILGGYSLKLAITNQSLLAIDPAAASGNIGSKKGGGAVGAAVAYQVAPASAAQAVNVSNLGMVNGAILRLTEPFLIPPGYGLTCCSPVVNNAAGMELEFFEEPVT